MVMKENFKNNLKRFVIIPLLLLSVTGIIFVKCNGPSKENSKNLEKGFDKEISAAEFLNPPDHYKTWVYWWWLKGWIDEEGIRADLDHMKTMGITGALVFHAGPAE